MTSTKAEHSKHVTQSKGSELETAEAGWEGKGREASGRPAHLAPAGLQQALLDGELHDLIVLVLQVHVSAVVLNVIGFRDFKYRLINLEVRGLGS